MIKKSRLKKICLTLGIAGTTAATAIPVLACGEDNETEKSVWDVLKNTELLSDTKLEADLGFNNLLKAETPTNVAITFNSEAIVDRVKAISEISKLGEATLAKFTSENVIVEPNDIDGTFKITFQFGTKERILIVSGFLSDEENANVSSLFKRLDLVTSEQLASNLQLNPSLQVLPSNVSFTKDEAVAALVSITSDDLSPAETSFLKDQRMQTEILQNDEAGTITVKITWGNDGFAISYIIEGFASLKSQQALNQKIENLSLETFLAEINLPPEVLLQLPSEAVKDDLSAKNVARLMRQNITEINTLEDDVKQLLTADMISFEEDDINGVLKVIISYKQKKLNTYNLQGKYDFYSVTDSYNNQIWNDVISQASEKDIADALGIKINTTQLPSEFKAPTESETASIIKKIRGYSEPPPKIKNYQPKFTITIVEADDNKGELVVKIKNNIDSQEKSWILTEFANLSNINLLKTTLDGISQSDFDSQIGISQEERTHTTAIEAIQKDLNPDQVLQLMKTNLNAFKNLDPTIQMLITSENIQVTPLNDQGQVVVTIQFQEKVWTFKINGFINGPLDNNLRKLEAGIQSLSEDTVTNAITTYQTGSGVTLDKDYLPVSGRNSEIVSAEVITQILKDNLSIAPEIKNLLLPEMIKITPSLSKGTISITVNISGNETSSYFLEGFKAGEDSWIDLYAKAINKINPEQIKDLFSEFTSPTGESGQLTKATASHAAKVFNQGETPDLIIALRDLINFDPKTELIPRNAFTKMWYKLTTDDSTGTLYINFTNNIPKAKDFEISGFLTRGDLETAKTTVFNALNSQTPPTELFNALGFDLYNLDSNGNQPQDDLTDKNKATLEIEHLKESWINGNIPDINRLGNEFASLFYNNPVLSRSDADKYLYSKYTFNGYQTNIAEDSNPAVDAEIQLLVYDPSYDPPADKTNPDTNDHVLINITFSTLDLVPK